MKKLLTGMALALLLFACKKTELQVQTQSAEINAGTEAVLPQVKVLNNQLNYPWEILWGADKQIWFTEREGYVKKMDPVTGNVTMIAKIKDVASTTNFNGLLGMVLHPQFKTHPYVYVVYNYFGPKDFYLEKIVRFIYNGNTLISPLTIVDSIIGKKNGSYIHNGSRLTIGPDMKLYATTGDADKRYILPQNPKYLNGKILRVNLDGSIPADNPFGNAVWATGQRNPQGLVFANGFLYSSMHGQETNDEINIIQKGRNYGWPYVEGFCDKSAELPYCQSLHITEPIYAWTPTIAPSGLDYYNNNAMPPLKNSLLLAVLKDEELLQLQLDASGTSVTKVKTFLKGRFGRLRDVAISPDGKVFICTDNGNNSDMIIEITAM